MEERLKKLMESLPEGMDGALLLAPVHRRYYLGIVSSAGTLLVTREKSYFIVDFRYIEMAKQRIRGTEVILQEELAGQLEELAARNKLHCIGVDISYVTLTVFGEYQRMLGGRLTDDCRLEQVIAGQRGIKSREERACLGRAAQIAEQVFRRIVPYIRPGVRSDEVQRRLGILASEEGSERGSFGFVVSVGGNWTESEELPDHFPPGKVIDERDVVTLRIATQYRGYWADMSRSICMEKAGAERLKSREQVERAQRLLMKALKPGKRFDAAIARLEEWLADEGIPAMPDYGCGVGLEIREGVMLEKDCPGVSQEGMVLNVGLRIQEPGGSGVAARDMVVITQQGAEFLGRADLDSFMR